MRNSLIWQVFALAAALLFGGTVVAQPPGRGPGPGGRGGPGGFGGPGGGLERALDDLKLTRGKQDDVLTAVRANQDNVGRMTEVVSSGLLLKLKEILSAEEFRSLKDATDKARVDFGGPNGRGRVSDADVLERLLSFDKNKDGKLTREDLPERMQSLFDKGDTNKDGFLDRDEIQKLITELSRDGSQAGGRGGPGGRGGNGNVGNARVSSPGRGLTLEAIEKAVGDLKLSQQKKEAAVAAIKAQKEEASKLTTVVRGEMLLEVSEILNDEEFTKVKALLERQPGVGERPNARPVQQGGGGRGGPGGFGGPGGQGGGRGGPGGPGGFGRP